MSMNEKRAILGDYFRKNGMPNGCITVDNDMATIGNVSVNGTFYGVFDYKKREFVSREEF